jgi:hemerythrin-like domain-containing protein
MKAELFVRDTAPAAPTPRILMGGAAMAILEREAIEVNAATYVAYYRQHMAGEEADLFPRVEGFLSNADWKAVSDAIPLEADPLFGRKVGQRYQRLHQQILLASKAGDANA